jgi:hypothetical protein
MAALMGGMGADFGGRSDFGADFGDEWGPDFGDDMGDDWGADYGDDMGADFGDSYGADFGAAHSAHHRGGGGHRPHPAVMARVHAQSHAKLVSMNKRRKSRELLLDPNQGSTLKVENYTFAVNIKDQTTGLNPVFGTAGSVEGENTPNTYLRPRRVTINVPIPGLLFVQAISVGNVNGTVGGQGDAWDYNANAVDTRQSYPLLSSSTKVSFLGSWTTPTPQPYNVGDSFGLVMSFKGPATMLPRG